MKINDAIFGAIFALLGAVVLVHVQSFPNIPGQQYGAAIFPGLIAAGFVVCGVLLVFSGMRSRAEQPWFAAGAVAALAAPRRRRDGDRRSALRSTWPSPNASGS